MALYNHSTISTGGAIAYTTTVFTSDRRLVGLTARMAALNIDDDVALALRLLRKAGKQAA